MTRALSPSLIRAGARDIYIYIYFYIYIQDRRYILFHLISQGSHPWRAKGSIWLICALVITSSQSRVPLGTGTLPAACHPQGHGRSLTESVPPVGIVSESPRRSPEHILSIHLDMTESVDSPLYSAGYLCRRVR